MTTTLKPIAHKPDLLPKASFGKVGWQNVTIRTLLLQKAQYYNIHPRQRAPIWPHYKRQKWIDTLLRPAEFMPLTQIYFNKVWRSAEEGGSLIYTVEDGLQRLFTIYLFLNDELKTFNEVEYHKRILIRNIPSLPFDKRFSELTEEMRQRFLEFSIPIIVAEEVDAEIADERYRRLNDGVQLTKGERMRSYRDTVASQLAELIATHPLWQENMKSAKRKDRQYRFELALYIILMKVHSFPIQMGINELELLAAGMSDYALTSRTQEEIFEQLERLAHVFDGIQITAKTDGIVVWQAGYYLQRAGCDFTACERGCLRPWFESAKIERLEKVNMGNLSSFAAMSHSMRQTQFWTAHKARLLDQAGLVFPDRDRWYRERHGEPPVLPHEPPFDPISGLVLTPLDSVLS